MSSEERALTIASSIFPGEVETLITLVSFELALKRMTSVNVPPTSMPMKVSSNFELKQGPAEASLISHFTKRQAVEIRHRGRFRFPRYAYLLQIIAIFQNSMTVFFLNSTCFLNLYADKGD